MKQGKLAVMLANLASLQTETGSHPELDASRLEEGILGRPPFTPAEIDALWSSPSLRQSFLDVRRTVIGRFRSRWEASSFSAPAILRAAAGNADLTIVQGNGWIVEIVQLSDASWAISLTLSVEARAQIPAMAEILLADDGLLEWGRGRLSGQGALDFEWPHAESPLVRMHSHRLAVDLV